MCVARDGDESSNDDNKSSWTYFTVLPFPFRPRKYILIGTSEIPVKLPISLIGAGLIITVRLGLYL